MLASSHFIINSYNQKPRNYRLRDTNEEIEGFLEKLFDNFNKRFGDIVTPLLLRKPPERKTSFKEMEKQRVQGRSSQEIRLNDKVFKEAKEI